MRPLARANRRPDRDRGWTRLTAATSPAVLLGRVLSRLCVVVVALQPQHALACRCREPAIATAYRRADAVVQALVVKVVPTPQPPGSTAILAVSKTWRRDLPDEIAVSTVTDCAYEWREGREYVLFLVRDSTGVLSTGRCLGNRPVEDAGDMLTWLQGKGEPGEVRKDIRAEPGSPPAEPSPSRP